MPRVIIDAGSEVKLPKAAWMPIARLNVNTQVIGAIEGMGGRNHWTIETVLLGISNTAFNKRPEQTESLIYSYKLWYNNVVAHNRLQEEMEENSA